MRKVSPLGGSVLKYLGLLLVTETLLFAGSTIISKRQVIPPVPRDIGEWTVSGGSDPVSDVQRDNPNQRSVVYTNGDLPPVHVNIAVLSAVDGARQPQKYLVDSDGRVNPLNLVVLMYRRKIAYNISFIGGIDQSVFDLHWCQKVGTPPVPTAADNMPALLKSIFIGRPQYYVCDVWVQWHPTSNGADTSKLLQRFANAISDSFRTGR